MERECVLQLSSNPLFTPVPVMDGRLPLRDCVLSVSQFTGAERESLVELAKHLGARYPNIYWLQGHVGRRATYKHLVLI